MASRTENPHASVRRSRIERTRRPIPLRSAAERLDGVGCVSPVRSLARWTRYTYVMTALRLTCSVFWVDVRLREINGRWIASADTPDVPVPNSVFPRMRGALRRTQTRA